MAGVLLWWFVSARTWFRGPKVNVEREFLCLSSLLPLRLYWFRGDPAVGGWIGSNW